MAEHIEDIKNPATTEVVGSKASKIDSIVNNYSGKDVEDFVAKFVEMSNDAQANDAHEKSMTLKEGIATFPKAAFWSVVLSTAIIMEGFDTNLLASLYNQTSFQIHYGRYYPDLGEYQIPAKWQTSLSMAVNVGEIIGLWLAGITAERYGYRPTLIVSMMLAIGFIFIIFYSVSIEMLLVGELLCGVVWGAFQTLTVSYASEVCPVVLRVYLTTYVNACWVIGQLISSCVLKGTLSMDTQWAYKIPWALQWIWPIPIIIGVYFAPESPWWLCKKGRLHEARTSIRRLLSKNKNLPDVDVLADAMLSKMQLTITHEKQQMTGSSYWDCFRGVNLRRTRVASMIWVLQNITGSALMGYSTYFYTQAGLDQGMSFTFSIIQYALGLIGTLLSWILSQKYGRFTIFFGGMLINFIILIIVGSLGCANSSGASWGIGSLLLVFTFVYDSTVGPITYCVVAEIPSAQVRSKTVAVARNFYNLAGIPVAVITPYMLNPTAWNWKAKTGFFWAGFSLFGLIWTWFEFPETKGRTYAELDVLFKNGVKARKFKTTEVETFNTEEMLANMDDDHLKQVVLEKEEEEKEEMIEDAKFKT